MLPPAYLPLLLLLLATPSATGILNITDLLPITKPPPNSLTLNPIPNPFPVPNTDITLDFATPPHLAPLLPQTDVTDCFALAKVHFETLIHEHGDGPIAYSYEMTYGRVTLKMFSENAPMRCITYGEALSVLLGISLKMAREGFEFRRLHVLQSDDGELLGMAVLEDVEWQTCYEHAGGKWGFRKSFQSFEVED
ncbi:hypothetical protein HO173_011071 [Letharia columbiana]|uniref:Uncharacterized protein n=1 Tax=Letharia columbiana TaxID=112416 RepID=A0A8H6FLI3_9LECA|nr:uncharacterized protein HO173_011071 [Letharia columbiana]KAF6230719.1 hypothetical protein HO173_011071 [Letharia columbiana]